MRPCCRCSRSGRAACGRPPRPGRSATAASRWWRARRGSPRPRFSAACANSDGRRRCRRHADAAGRVAGASGRPTTDPTLLRDLDALVEPTAPGDPESPLRWTCLSVRTLAVALEGLGHTSATRWSPSCCTTSATACKATSRPAKAASIRIATRNFATSRGRSRAGAATQQPTISVDTKKKELVGDFKNGGRAWRPAKTPQRVRVHDFVIPGPATGGKAIPYGVYDLHRDEGWVSVGIDHDTASFAVQSIRRWWQHDGPTGLSRGPVAADHRRCRRQQRRAPAALEMGIAAARQSHRARPSRSVTSRRARASGTRSSIACSRTSP